MKVLNLVNISVYVDKVVDLSDEECEIIYNNILLGTENSFKDGHEDTAFTMSDGLKFIFDQIKNSVEKTYLDKEVQKIEYWGHLHEKNMSTQDHAHFDIEANRRGENWLSGVFYLKVPEGSGNLVFLYSKNPFHEGPFDIFCEYSPENNIFLIFPTWLLHRVTRNKSENHRVSIGFNVLIREKTGFRYQPEYTTRHTIKQLT